MSVYLDANATTFIPQSIITEMTKWYNRGNPSAQYKSAMQARNMIDGFKHYLSTTFGFDNHEIIITSCASESNSTIIDMVVKAYNRAVQRSGVYSKPHIILSAIEHKSLLLAVEAADCDVTLIKPTSFGVITATAVRNAITDKTCLISVMHANNETGIFNPIEDIAAVAHDANIPFHTDAVQSFGKVKLPMKNIDAVSISCHKYHGPVGVGILAVRKPFIEGYELQAMVHGTQNNGMRGGTENTPAIVGAWLGIQHTWTNRLDKNEKLNLLRKRFINNMISANLKVYSYNEYMTNGEIGKYGISIVVITPINKDKNTGLDRSLQNTVLFSLVKKCEPYICNSHTKKELEDLGIIISVGSACNTANKKASHVLYEIGADEVIRRGALRMSMPDDATEEHINKLTGALVHVINNKKCFKENK